VENARAERGLRRRRHVLERCLERRCAVLLVDVTDEPEEGTSAGLGSTQLRTRSANPGWEQRDSEGEVNSERVAAVQVVRGRPMNDAAGDRRRHDWRADRGPVSLLRLLPGDDPVAPPPELAVAVAAASSLGEPSQLVDVQLGVGSRLAKDHQQASSKARAVTRDIRLGRSSRQFAFDRRGSLARTHAA